MIGPADIPLCLLFLLPLGSDLHGISHLPALPWFLSSTYFPWDDPQLSVPTVRLLPEASGPGRQGHTCSHTLRPPTPMPEIACGSAAGRNTHGAPQWESPQQGIPKPGLPSRAPPARFCRHSTPLWLALSLGDPAVGTVPPQPPFSTSSHGLTVQGQAHSKH